MTDQSVNLYRRMCRADRTFDVFCKAKDTKKARQQHKIVLDLSDQYEKADPSTKTGVLLKAKEAVASLTCTEHDSAVDLVRGFFRTHKTFDVEWLRQLGYRATAVSMMAPDNGYANNCLQSIIRGMSSKRLA